MTRAVLQSVGVSASSREAWKRMVKTGASSVASSLRMCADMLSGPVALCTFSLCRRASNTVFVTVMSGMLSYGLEPLFGICCSS